jgi:hypothetical protein
MKDIDVVHIHAQPQWHDEAFIVANRSGLLKLREAIDRALEEGSAQVELMPADGECFNLHIIVGDEDWQSEFWKKAALPYTDELASEKRPDAVWPWHHV